MVKCNKCSAALFEDSKFCPNCGQDQREVSDMRQVSSTMLTTLCILTIVGSMFTIGRALLYEIIASIGSGGYYRGWIYTITSIGTISGAVLMLQRRFIGLKVYTVFQIIYILTVIFATLDHSSSSLNVGSLAFGIAMIFLIPSIFFLIIYWTKNILAFLK